MTLPRPTHLIRSLPILLVAGMTATARAQTPLPTADQAGTADNALVKRLEGSLIISYEMKKLEELAFPLAKLVPAPGNKRDAHSRLIFAPKKAKKVEGAYTHLLYLLPPNSSSLEVARGYAQAIKAGGGKILYECKEAECGGDPHRGVFSTSAGDQGLSMYLYPEERVKEAYASPGYCAMNAPIAKQKYLVAELAGGAGVVSVLAFETPESAGGNCNAFKGATFASVDLVQTARPQKP